MSAGLTLFPVALLALGGLLAGPAEEAYREGDLERARRLYEERLAEEPGDLKTRYNLGNVQYRAEELEAAQEAYRASLQSDDLRLRSAAAHNLGNARLLAGDLDGAIQAYQDALRARPGSADSRYNLELALRMKEMPPPQSQQQQGQQGQSDQQKQEQQEERNQNGQKEQQGQEEERSEERQEKEEQSGQEQQRPPQQEEQTEQQPSPETQPQEDRSAQSMPASSPEDYTSQEAQRVLDGLAQEERDLLAERMRAQGRSLRVEKDW